MPNLRTGADAQQHGGSHYKGTPVGLEHWNVVAALGWDYFIASATKYLWRFGKKGDPLEQLDKAIHFLQKRRELLVVELKAKELYIQIQEALIVKER